MVSWVHSTQQDVLLNHMMRSILWKEKFLNIRRRKLVKIQVLIWRQNLFLKTSQF